MTSRSRNSSKRSFAKCNHPLITPYAEQLVARYGKFKGNAILANPLARAIYFILQKGTAFDPERVVGVASEAA
jgi:hypothetical protein